MMSAAKRTKLSRTVFTALTALGGLLLSGSAHAESLLHPASFCGVSSGDAGFYYDGSVVNRSTSSKLELVCPISARSDLPLIKSGAVRVVDRNCNANADVVCTLTAQWIDNAGVVRWWQTADMRTSGCSAFPRALTVPANFGNGSENLVMRCTLPAAYVVGGETRVSLVSNYQISR